MLKFILYIVLFTFAENALAQDMVLIRELYTRASTEKKSCDSLQNIVKNSNNTTLNGYDGASTLLYAEHYWNPYDKLKAFNNGKTKLDNAIKADSSNIELRYLRYSIQKNAPSFLGYNENTKEDRALLIYMWKYITDTDLKKRVKDFLITYGDCTETEKVHLKE